MTNNRCLYCYQPNTEEGDFHAHCSKKVFGTAQPPLLEHSIDEMLNLAERVVLSHTAVTGVQPKLSLGLQEPTDRHDPKKLTIVGVWGDYILKPPSIHYAELPELEDVTMHLAELVGIKTVPHTLIRLASGELSYLTKRIDRIKNGKLHMEDMCQITGKLTEAKYRGSYEQIAKAIAMYSANPLFDIISFFELVLFSFLTGNNDMHLKNFSLLKHPKQGYILSPAYDLVASSLVVENDTEELALTLNGKKRKIRKIDFETVMTRFHIPASSQHNIFKKFVKAYPKWLAFIEQSFLSTDMKTSYNQILADKQEWLNI